MKGAGDREGGVEAERITNTLDPTPRRGQCESEARSKTSDDARSVVKRHRETHKERLEGESCYILKEVGRPRGGERDVKQYV